MKKITLILAVLTLLSTVATTGCKKGENDPGLSFRSRKARLTGEWNLTSGEVTSDYIQSSAKHKITNTFDGKSRNSKHEIDGKIFGKTSTVDFSETLTINKDYTFVREQKTIGGTIKFAGSWFWLGKNKSEDLKNKEAIGFNTTDVTNGGKTNTIEGLNNVQIFSIKQLKNKEIIFTTYQKVGDKVDAGEFTYGQ